eukprot:CAMPEP_0194125152 /NCGR_PEP_ID=MMETSP0150-20130528/59311_1 /TAXON_ID=122233 /ORGANISM="Chaetoceros debilis, Strain MM31A-1" /LENGTH=751 /DNA_ID=CAMNT_0038818947 /DNA_START=128 /DNA_END=2383 /DNA_ORIENTATION=-
MNPVTLRSSRNRPQQSIRSALLVLLVIFFSVASLCFSRDAVKNFTYVFQTSGINIYGYYGTDGSSKVSTVTGSGTSMTMKSDDDDDDDDGGDTNLDDMYNDAPSGIKGAEHEEDDGGGDEVRGDVKYSDADAVNHINNDDDVDNDDYRGDMGYTTEDGRKRMNVLILYPDDWRHNSIGKENPIIQTPFLDSLADDGIRFRQNAVTTSICWQSRATLFSGQWASRHQSYKLKCPHFSKGRLWNQTWPILLEKDGYFVGHVGKWQFHSDNRERFSWSKYHEGKHWYGRFGRGLVAAEDVAKEDAIKFLNERPKDKPFAMTVARQNAVTTSICWQSRATLFSGQWASRHQSYKLKCPHFARGQGWNQTWPKLLQDDGYFVGHVGKWQFYSDNNGRFSWSNYHEGNHFYPMFGRGEVAADDVAKEDAIKFLDERPKDKPFAMTVAFYPPKPVGDSPEPGGQWRPKNETRALYENITIPEPYNMTHAFSLLPKFLQYDRSASVQRKRKRYRSPLHYQEAMKNIYALITQVDQACKDIVDEVKKKGLYNNTMIIFSTDNGMFHGSHGLAGKWYPYQESIRVPLIIHDPRMPADKVGSIDDNFTLNVDLAETILGAAGLKPHERMQGRDISDLYLPNKSEDDEKTALEETPWRDEFFYEFTFGDETYIPSSNALVRKKWKFIDWYGHNHEQLFDLEEDPLEFTDVKDRAENAEILSEMRSKLAMYKEQLTEPRQLNCESGDYSANPAVIPDDGAYLPE